MSNKQLLQAIRKDVRRIVREKIKKGKRVTIYPSKVLSREIPDFGIYAKAMAGKLATSVNN